MDDCLAATGADSSGILMLAAALLVLGAAFSVIAVRRGRGRAALFLLALPLFAAGALVAQAPVTAQAQVAAPCSTPPPTCTPEEAVEGSLVSSRFGMSLNDSGTSYFALYTDNDAALYQSVLDAVFTIDPEAQVSAAAFVVSEEPPVGPVTLEPGDFSFENDALNVDRSVFEEIVGSAESGTFRVDITFTYDDGCGGALTTVFGFTSNFDFVQVP